MAAQSLVGGLFPNLATTIARSIVYFLDKLAITVCYIRPRLSRPENNEIIKHLVVQLAKVRLVTLGQSPVEAHDFFLQRYSALIFL